ncbi:hypothetical protein AAW06_12715 [Escherichia coli]|nr:hypothetical protein AAW06_12715 [Escherichia coli]
MPASLNRIYSIPVVAKSTAGRENPFNTKATQTPKASFFCVVPAHTRKTDRINGGAGGAAFGLAGSLCVRFSHPRQRHRPL